MKVTIEVVSNGWVLKRWKEVNNPNVVIDPPIIEVFTNRGDLHNRLRDIFARVD